MNSNHQIFTSPLSVSQEKNIHWKAALQTSLVLTFALMLLSTLLALTSCESPINIDTPRTTTADVVWQNSGTLTAVASLQGKEPDVNLQIERMVGTTNGTTYVSQVFKGSFTATAGLEKLVRDVPFGYVAGKININASDFIIGTAASRQLASGLYGIIQAPAWNKIPATITLNDLTLSDNSIVIPETRRITSLNENSIIKTSENLTVQIDKAAEQGTETEVLFYGSDYRLPAVIKSVTQGANSVVLNSTDLKNYVSSNNFSYAYYIAVRVKSAKTANDGKVALAGVSTSVFRVNVE